MVTRRPGIMLGIVTADCAPVLFADREAGIVGAAHAGWKGAIGGVTDSTITAMEALGAQRERIVAAVGPCIAQASYEVDEGFRDLVTQAPSIAALRRHAVKHGMHPLRLAGALRVAEGKTTVDEVLSATPSPS